MSIFGGKGRKNNMYASLSDEHLFSLIKRDDECAFTELYNRHSRHLYAMVFKYLKSDEYVENALQNVFMSLWSNRKDLYIPNNIKGYLYTSMKNNALNILKRERIGIRKAYEMNQTTYCDSILPEIERREREEIIQVEIDRLTPKLREIIALKRSGFSNDEIADKLNIPLNTVKVYYSRAIRLLKEKFSKKYTLLIILIVYITYKI